MPLRSAHIIGSGPNGLAAAITLAQAGVAVTVFERSATLGGACSTAELTLPGFRHDVGSSVYPLGVASPFFRSLPLEQYGVRWIHPPAPCAHPLDSGAATLEPTVEATAAQFSAHDRRAWQHLFAPSVRDWQTLVSSFTQPLLQLPRSPVAMASFGSVALFPARTLARAVFQTEPARALFAGLAAHAVLPLTRVASAATGIVLAAAGHSTGWPILAGGAQSLTDALAAHLRTLGGTLQMGFDVTSLSQLPPADVTLFDTSTAALDRIAGDALTRAFRTRLRHFRRGPGIFKLDYALREPIPWRDARCLRAATVHVGGTLDEVTASEQVAFFGRPDRDRNSNPLVLVVQPSLFDATRAPAGTAGRRQHTAWAYCHVPPGSDLDHTDAIERQIERFAPGFRDVILARRAWNSSALEQANPNLQGGDVSGGNMTLPQLLARPTLRLYRTSNPALYLCSSSTPPGGGVHGMCGHVAALMALRDHA